jgi:Zn finger protein HypA/HybF involved in hydrogenase expression
MHDQIYAQQIIKQAEEHGTIRTISIEVGDIAPLTKEQLENAIKSQRPGWRVKIYKKEGNIKCQKCGFEGKPEVIDRGHEEVFIQCPVCENSLPEIVDGENIILKSVEVDE